MHTRKLVFSLTAILLMVITLTISHVQAAQVQLSWKAPTTNADGTPLTDLAGYKVYYGQASRNYTFTVNVGNTTTYTISNLTAGQTYYFAATAYDTSANESVFSNEWVYTPASLSITNVSPQTYQVKTLQVGDTYYIDRSYTIQALPAELAGLLGIQTANNDKYNNLSTFLTFSVNQNITLYVAYDSQATAYPPWLTSAYTNTGQTIATSNTSLTVSRREFPAGTIALPGNYYGSPSGVSSNYIVLVELQEVMSNQPWMWVQANDEGIASPLHFSLDAGEHSLVIKQRQAGTRIDRLLLTNDLEYIPR